MEKNVGPWIRDRGYHCFKIKIFGKDNFFIEIMDHGLPEQRQILPELLRLSSETGIPPVATNDPRDGGDIDDFGATLLRHEPADFARILDEDDRPRGRDKCGRS